MEPALYNVIQFFISRETLQNSDSEYFGVLLKRLASNKLLTMRSERQIGVAVFWIFPFYVQCAVLSAGVKRRVRMEGS